MANEIATTQPKFVKLNKQRRDFLNAWLDMDSPTFANAYQSAKAVGFSEHYARVLTTDAKNIEWVQQGKDILRQFTPMHIAQGFQHIAANSPYDRDKIQALDRLAKIHGLYIDRSEQNVNVKFINGVPRPTRPIIDIDTDVKED